MAVFWQYLLGLQLSGLRIFKFRKVEPTAGIEPVTYGLQSHRPLPFATNPPVFELIFAIIGTIEHAINLYKSYKPPTCGSKMADYATSGINE